MKTSSSWDDGVFSTFRSIVSRSRYAPMHLSLVASDRAGSAPEWLQKGLPRLPSDPLQKLIDGLPSVVREAIPDPATSPRVENALLWVSRVLATGADRIGARVVDEQLRARAGIKMLEPHPEEVGVLVLDMRGFSRLTADLGESTYVANLVEEYLTAMTDVVERHYGIVLNYTGDGLVALFHPGLSRRKPHELLPYLADEVAPDLHRAFGEIIERWTAEWEATGKRKSRVGLGVGVAFGPSTVGLMGPSGKKSFGVVGEPINLAAWLCSQAEPGSTLVDRESFAKAGAPEPDRKPFRLKSPKLHQRIETYSLVPA